MKSLSWNPPYLEADNTMTSYPNLNKAVSLHQKNIRTLMQDLIEYIQTWVRVHIDFSGNKDIPSSHPQILLNLLHSVYWRIV